MKRPTRRRTDSAIIRDPVPVPPSSIAASIAAQDIQSELDDKTLGAQNLALEADYRLLINDEIQQRINIKRTVLLSSIAVMVVMLGILACVLSAILRGKLNETPPAAVLALCLSPIISMTTITIMLLVGAFRRFKDDDLDKVNVSDIAKLIPKS